MELIHSLPPDLVPDAQRRAIRTLVNLIAMRSTPGEVVTKANLDRIAEDMMKALGTAGQRPFFRSLVAWAQPLEKISSQAWNDAQDRLFVDLYSLYRGLSQASADDAYRGEVTRDEFTQIKGAILRIVNEIRIFQFLKSNPEYQDAKFINFSSSLNESLRSPRAAIDSDVRLLELAPRSRQVQSKRNVGLRGTEVKVEHLGGGRPGGTTAEFGVDNILDSNPDSFWAEMIMADGPIVQTYHPSGDGGLGSEFESRGAICHVYLTMSQVVTANTIQILPFGEYPVRVIDVAYKESAGQSNWRMIPTFRVEPAGQDWIEVNFEPAPISVLRITLEQVNYRTSVYHLPENSVRNGLVWLQITQARGKQVLSDLSITAAQKEEIAVDPSLYARLQSMEDFKYLLDQEALHQGREQEFKAGVGMVRAGNLALTKIRPDLADKVGTVVYGTQQSGEAKTIRVRTYEYVYGLREIRLQYNLYEPLGHYSSQKFQMGSSVLEVSLVTEERHPIHNDGLGDFYKTSTEWEIEVGRDRRYPIAPRNWRISTDPDAPSLSQQLESGNLRNQAAGNTQIIVPDEYLQFDRISRTALTRLPIADTSVSLRKNGQRVSIERFKVQKYTPPLPTARLMPGGAVNNIFQATVRVPRVLQERGLITYLDEGSFDPNAVFTVKYVARDDADLINVDEDLDPVEGDPEIFKETNRDSQLVLKSVPYVNLRIVHNTTRWEQVGEESKWIFTPAVANFRTGTASVTNGSTLVQVTYGWSGLSPDYPHVFRVDNEPDGRIYKVARIDGADVYLSEPYQGETNAAASYTVGEYFEIDGTLYAFERNTYEPLRVIVNDVRAVNMTDYLNAEHRAFTDVAQAGKQIQYVHSGSILYFNRPVQGKIEVYYQWLTEFVRVNGVLRSNLPVRTVLTPQVNSARIELKTSRL